MTTREILRKKAEHSYKIHQMEQDRLNKEKVSSWSWIKREIFFAEELTNWQLFKLTIKMSVAAIVVYLGAIGLYGLLHILTGVR
jgi:hypothetical protein